MDLRIRGFAASHDEIELTSQPLPFVSDSRIGDFHFLEHGTTIEGQGSVVTSSDYDGPEDCDFSDAVLSYISEMLMEEDIEDKSCMLHDSLELRTTEKSLYDAIGQKYPSSPNHSPNYAIFSDNQNEYPVDNISSEYNISPQAQNIGPYSNSQSSFSSSSSVANTGDSPDSIIQNHDVYHENQSLWNFKKGVEEANKFLPTSHNLLMKIDHNGEPFPSGSRVKKNSLREDFDLEKERLSKQAAVYPESTLRSEMFDEVLICLPGEVETPMTIFRDSLQIKTSKNMTQNGPTKGYNGKRGSVKKNVKKKEVVDLRTLMITCAQAVAADDHRNANELVKQIKLYASPFGDGNQRLAHCFADGLEARLAGTGSQIYKGLMTKRASATDILKAYKLYVAACPFRKISHFVSNRTIINLSVKSMRLHVIDFGILYGFQWPTFIQRLSTRVGGPPMLRITGIDFPQPGFRPAERVEETGRRLAEYAKSFGVPFEYIAIAKKWETIQPEELKIEKDEVLVVNSIYRFKNLLDDSVAMESCRNMVVNLIRKINPDLFIHGIVSGAYNAPFFVTRFREALFHFSAIFDMLETIVPREYPERMLLEREIFGKEAVNVIACEGWERVERPETYKQWQLRNLRGGFRQIPFHREVMKKAKERVKSNYHKDFVVDEDGQWFLQGWKGRTIYALSTWKPV